MMNLLQREKRRGKDQKPLSLRTIPRVIPVIETVIVMRPRTKRFITASEETGKSVWFIISLRTLLEGRTSAVITGLAGFIRIVMTSPPDEYGSILVLNIFDCFVHTNNG